MLRDLRSPNEFHVVWIYAGPLMTTLDAATWLKTVNELRGFGWRVTLVAAGPKGYHQISGVEVLCIPRPDVYLFRQVAFHLRVLNLLLRQWATIDVILFHERSVTWILLLRFVRFFTAKRWPVLVMDTRSLPMPPYKRQTWKDKLRKRAYLIENLLGNRCADGRLAITRRMAEVVGITAKKLWGTWPSGVNLEQFASAQTVRRWPSPGEPVHLIYIGALHHERNLIPLSQAVEQANAEGMAFRLRLLGDGTARPELEQFAARSAGQIQICRPVPHEQVPEVLARAHVGVLPFPDEEKFRVSSPIKLFEYMAAGLPILATRIVCHTDVVGSGEYAFWAKDSATLSLVEALRLIWQSRGSLRIMGRRAAKAAERWTWTASAMKLKQSLECGTAARGHKLRTLSNEAHL